MNTMIISLAIGLAATALYILFYRFVVVRLRRARSRTQAVRVKERLHHYAGRPALPDVRVKPLTDEERDALMAMMKARAIRDAALEPYKRNGAA